MCEMKKKKFPLHGHSGVSCSKWLYQTIFLENLLNTAARVEFIKWLTVNICHYLSWLRQEITSQQALLTFEGYSDSHVWD